MQWRAVAALLCTLTLGGCFLVAAGAGAGAAIAYTSRGATSVVAGTVDQAFDRSVSAIQQSGITETGRSTEERGAKRRLVGTKGDLDITVELTRATATTTTVEVIAKKNAVDCDKKLAKDVLNRIVHS